MQCIHIPLGSEDPQEHFMIVDDEKMIISSKVKNRLIPTPIGNRKGQIVIVEPRKIKEKTSEFERLKEKAIKKGLLLWLFFLIHVIRSCITRIYLYYGEQDWRYSSREEMV